MIGVFCGTEEYFVIAEIFLWVLLPAAVAVPA